MDFVNVRVFAQLIINMGFLLGFRGYMRTEHASTTMLLLLVEFVRYLGCVHYWKLLETDLFRFYHLGQVHDLLLSRDEGVGKVVLGVVEEGEIFGVLELNASEVFLE